MNLRQGFIDAADQPEMVLDIRSIPETESSSYKGNGSMLDMKTAWMDGYLPSLNFPSGLLISSQP